MYLIYCPQFGAQNAGNCISELTDFKIFWGGPCPQIPLDDGALRPLNGAWWPQIFPLRLLLYNHPPTSNFNETPELCFRFVGYETVCEAEAAIQKFDGFDLGQDHRLKVALALPKQKPVFANMEERVSDGASNIMQGHIDEGAVLR